MSLAETKLGEVLQLYNGKKPQKNEDGEFDIFGSNGKIGRSKAFNHPSSIILGRVGAYCGSVEYSETPLWASDNTIVTRPKDGHDLNYWYYKLKTCKLRDYAGGAAQPLITHSIIKPIPVCYHEQEEDQKRIAGVLSAYDDLIENNRRRIALLEDAARLIYREWFVHFRFPNHENTKFENGLPMGWERTTIGKHCPFLYGKALKADARIDGANDVYGSSGVVGTHNKYLVDKDTIIIGRKGNVGSVFWSSKPFWPIDTVYYIEPNNADLFTLYALNHVAFINTDVAVPGLNRNFAHSRELVLPTPNLLDDFNDRGRNLMAQKLKLEDQNQALTKARDLLLPRLMDGRIPV